MFAWDLGLLAVGRNASDYFLAGKSLRGSIPFEGTLYGIVDIANPVVLGHLVQGILQSNQYTAL